MKREDLEKLGLAKEQVDQIMAAHGKDITELQGKAQTADEAVAAKKKVEEEFEAFKKSKMTADEKRKAEEDAAKAEQQRILDEAKAAKTNYETLTKKTKVKEILIGGGISQADADKFVDGLVSETEESSITRAKDFVSFVSTEKTAAAAKALEEAARGLPQPQSKTKEPPVPQAPKSVW